MNFRLIDRQTSKLWDFGWFDRSVFAIEGADPRDIPCDTILREFLQSSIYGVSFCRPDDWGDAPNEHGPFRKSRMDSKWLVAVDLPQLRSRVEVVLADPRFVTELPAHQRSPIDGWLESLSGGATQLFVLDAPEDADAFVEWAYVWVLFWECMSLNRSAAEITVAVIGYD